MRVTIQNWKKYNPRPDVERPSWFRLEFDLMLKPDNLERFGAHEILAIIYLFSLALANRATTFNVVRAHAELFSRLKWSELTIAIEKLQREQVLTVDVTPAARYETRRDETRRDETRREYTDSEKSEEMKQPELFTKPQEEAVERKVKDLPRIAQIWNRDASSELPRVQSCSATRRKKLEKFWREKPEESFWVELIQRINASLFLTGRKPGSKGPFFADLNWVLEGENLDKILDGKYDERGAPAKPQHPFVAEVEKR